VPALSQRWGQVLREVEAESIRNALAAHGGHIQKAAHALGIGRNTLHRKMKEYGIS
jgi:transcriptional regulator of acetoin/glycerol metabolism